MINDQGDITYQVDNSEYSIWRWLGEATLVSRDPKSIDCSGTIFSYSNSFPITYTYI